MTHVYDFLRRTSCGHANYDCCLSEAKVEAEWCWRRGLGGCLENFDSSDCCLHLIYHQLWTVFYLTMTIIFPEPNHMFFLFFFFFNRNHHFFLTLTNTFLAMLVAGLHGSVSPPVSQSTAFVQKELPAQILYDVLELEVQVHSLHYFFG